LSSTPGSAKTLGDRRHLKNYRFKPRSLAGQHLAHFGEVEMILFMRHIKSWYYLANPYPVGF